MKSQKLFSPLAAMSAKVNVNCVGKHLKHLDGYLINEKDPATGP